MVRAKSANTLAADSLATNTGLPSGMDLLTLMQSGVDLQQLQREAQLQQAREKALEGFGILTVTINGNMPIQSNNNGMSILGRFSEQENAKVQTGDPLTPYLEKILAVNPELEVNLSFGESFQDSLMDKRAELGGNIEVSFALGSNCQLAPVQARFGADYPEVEDRRKPIFLIDPAGDQASPNNWTSENTGHPLMKLRLQAVVEQALTWSVAKPINRPLPEMDSLLELARNAASVSRVNLDAWSVRVNQERMDQQSTDAVNADAALATLK